MAVAILATHTRPSRDPAFTTSRFQAWCTLDGVPWVFDVPNAVTKDEASVQAWVVANVADGTLVQYRDSGRRLRPPADAKALGNSLDHAPRELGALLQILRQKNVLTEAEVQAIIAAWAADGG